MSSETMVTVVGNVATTPVFRELPTGPVARFRLASHARRFDRVQNTWVDGHTNFFTVWAWRGLGTNVQSSLALGEPVVVQGRLKVRDEERGGQHWTSADIEAVAIGHDLSRGTSAFRRSSQPRVESAAAQGLRGDSPWDVAKPGDGQAGAAAWGGGRTGASGAGAPAGGGGRTGASGVPGVAEEAEAPEVPEVAEAPELVGPQPVG
ncbi:single-stranded DNA-binding protein [Streptomyces sp. BYX5S]